MARTPLLAAACIAFGAFGCGGGEDGATKSDAGAPVPPPVRYRAPEVPLEKCSNADLVSGHNVRVAGMTCEDTNRIIKAFTTAFTDTNLRKPVVERGNGWRCYQNLSPSGFSVEEVCWRGNDQVLIFRK